MMVVVSCLVVSLMLFIHGQMVNSHAILPQVIDSLTFASQRLSTDQQSYNLEMDESSGMVETILEVPECFGTGSENYDINILNPSGCYIFKSTGFDNGGYPNFTVVGGIDYICAYTLKFGTHVDGKVTVKHERFEFQGESIFGDCQDSVSIRDVDDIHEQATNSDGDDVDGRGMVVTYCGTIDEDKTRDFSQSELSIDLFADRTVNGNGVEIHICID